MRRQRGMTRPPLEERSKLEKISVSCDFKQSNSQRSYLGSTVLDSIRNVGSGGRRPEKQPSFSYLKLNQNKGCLPLLETLEGLDNEDCESIENRERRRNQRYKKGGKSEEWQCGEAA